MFIFVSFSFTPKTFGEIVTAVNLNRKGKKKTDHNNNERLLQQIFI